MERTPVVGHLPRILLRNQQPARTPIIGGVAARLVSDLDWRATDAELAATAERAAAAPEADPAWQDVDPSHLAVSCALFASEVIRGPRQAPYHGRFIVGDHHEEWDGLLGRHPRICILAARDHGKSMYWTIAYPIWKAGFNEPKSEGIIFSATQPQAEEFLRKIKAELLENPKLSHLIPYSRDRYWSARAIKLRNGSIIRAAGFGVKIRGGHPDWVVCDDVLNDDDIYSETIRRRNIDYFLSAIAGMVHRHKQLIVVGTPMHEADLYQALKESGEYECRSYPALNREGVPLWPERYSLDDLQAKRRELNSEARFAREFLCRPMTDEASLFPSRLFDGPDVRLPFRLGLPAEYWDRVGTVRYTGVDIAMSAEVGADYFVIFTIAIDRKGNRWIANIRRGRGWSFSRQIDAIKEEHYLLRPEVIQVEANQAQRIWTDELARTTDLPVRRFFTTGVGGAQPKKPWRRGATSVAVNKHHLERGVPSLRMTLENRKWRIPRGDHYSIEHTDVWIGEMGAMGWVNGKVQSVGQHDDTVFACWMADTGARMENKQLEWVDTTPQMGGPSQLLASPVPHQDLPDQLTIQVEQRALAACQQGREVDCGREPYLARVRQALHQYAAQSMDAEEEERAQWALREIGRLDQLHGFRSYEHDPDVVKPDGSAYRPGWRPVEGAPQPDDMDSIR